MSIAWHEHCLALVLLGIAYHFLELALGLIISLLRQLGLNSMFSLVYQKKRAVAVAQSGHFRKSWSKKRHVKEIDLKLLCEIFQYEP